MIDVTNPGKIPELKQLHRKRRTPHITRGALLDAAVGLIDAHGWSAVTTTRVAAQAGLSRGALQHHFYTSQELILAVADELWSKLNSRFEPADFFALPLDERAEMLLRHYFEIYSGRLFRAFLSLMLDPTSEVAAHVRKKNLDQSQIHRAWHLAFSDTGVSEEKLAGLRRLIMSAVRGYALREQITEGKGWSEDLFLLKDLLLRELKSES